MNSFIPLFPLKLVAFPGENLNLHIFEPRYKELMKDIMAADQTFGIPPFVNNTIEFGTLMKVAEISRTYDDGRMDIRTRGLNVFRILDYHNPAEGKLYAAGNVEYLKNDIKQDPLQQGYMTDQLIEYYSYIQVYGETEIKEDMVSFDIAHHLGFSTEEEYTLLKMERETDRQQYIINYLDKIMPALKRATKAFEIIKMNGQFKNLDPIDF
jgi:Lon protease-like protein